LNEVVPLNFVNVAPADVKPGQINLNGARYKGVATVAPKGKYDESYSRVATITLAATSNLTGDLILHFLPV